MSNPHDAILSRVTLNGLGYIVDNVSKKEFSFTFDKIRNYRGESAEQLGLSPGAVILYQADGSGKIREVQIVKPKAGSQNPRKFKLF